VAQDSDRPENVPAGSGDDLPEIDVVIPDDARELDADRLAYLEELRARCAAGRREGDTTDLAPRGPTAWGWRSLIFTRTWERYGLSGPLLALILVGVAVLGSLSILLAPHITPLPPRLPLATATTAPPGRVGGLLPATTLVVGDRSRPARALRPVVLALLTPGCACQPALETVFQQAAEYRIRLWLVGPPAVQAEMAQLVRDTGNGTMVAALDATDAFGRAFVPSGLTVVVVHADGRVEAVMRDIAPGQRLDVALGRLRIGVPAE
jgi:hypothetical protein